MTISYPNMGDYGIAVEILLKKIFPDKKILPPLPITKKTLEAGAKNSPDFVCAPFKYNLGNFIESLECGADVLIQAGGGCRYGYYHELQDQILKDLGYVFKLTPFLKSEGVGLLKIYKTCKKLGSHLNIFQLGYNLLLAIKMIKLMDVLENYLRENIGFEVNIGSFDRLKKRFFEQLRDVKSFKDLSRLQKFYLKAYGWVGLDKPADALKVGVVGELYDLMEPFANHYLERELAKNKIAVSRHIDVSYLLFKKKKLEKKVLKGAEGYLKYAIGADGTESVAHSKAFARRGYDGIIHIKPFGCTPEVSAMPMLMKISDDYQIPVIYFSFDSLTSEAGVRTRLEAFYDMIKGRRESK